MSDSTRVTRVALGASEVEAERSSVQSDVRGSRLPALLAGFEPGPYGLSRSGLHLLDAVESGLVVMQALLPRLRDHLPDRLACCLSVWIGAQVLQQQLPSEVGTHIKVGGGFSDTDMMALVDRDQVAAALLSDYIQYLSFYRAHRQPDKRVDVPGGPLRCTQAYYQLLGNSLARLLRTHPEFPTVERLQIEVPGGRFQGLKPQQDESSSGLMDVSVDDIVGNQEFLRAGQRLARDVAGFDFESRQNPKKLNPIMFAMGDPGCGKTVTCHAIGHYFLQFCRQHSIPARFLIIRRSDWASSYQNASAAQLIDIFKDQVAGFPGVVGVYWPDIDTAFAAREDPGVRSEEKNILGACFGIFDGTIIPKNGQWFMLCDANTLNMDRAAISRITQDPFTLAGPVTPEDFITLMRDKKLRQHQPFVSLTEEEWTALGRLCQAMHLSGRSIENITRRVVTEVEDFEYPDEYFQSSLSRHEILKEQSKRLSYRRLVAILEHYKAFEKEAEERAYRSRFQDRVQEIVFNMSAQSAAVAVVGQPMPLQLEGTDRAAAKDQHPSNAAD